MTAHPHHPPTPAPHPLRASHAIRTPNDTRLRLTLPLVMASLVAAHGCGLPVGPNRRLILGYQATTADHATLRTVIPGLDLRLQSVHNGLNLGWSSTTESMPSDRSPTTKAPAQDWPTATVFQPPLAMAWKRHGIQHVLGWQMVKELQVPPDSPRFIDAQQAGLTVAINPHLTDLGFSISRHTFLIVPPDHNGTLKVRISPGDMPRFHSKQ